MIESSSVAYATHRYLGGASLICSECASSAIAFHAASSALLSDKVYQQQGVTYQQAFVASGPQLTVGNP